MISRCLLILSLLLLIELHLLGLFPSLTLQNFLGLLDSRKTPLFKPQFLGQFIPTPALAVLIVLPFIGRLGFCNQPLHFRFQLHHALFHPSVAHRLVLGCIGPNLRAVQRHMAKLD